MKSDAELRRARRLPRRSAGRGTRELMSLSRSGLIGPMEENAVTARVHKMPIRFYGVLRCLAATVALMVMLSITASAQFEKNATDGTTPLGIAPGAPAGSYPLSGFDTVNYYNGNLDFHLPLLKIGGRGEVSTALILALNTKRWHVKATTNCGSTP